MRSFDYMPAVEPRKHHGTLAFAHPVILPSPLRDKVGYFNHDRFRGYLSVHFRSGLQTPCLRFAGTVTGHHARLGTQLLAKLYCGRHFRRLYLMRLQGATLTEPYVNLSIHTAPIVQPLAYRPTASAQTDTAAPSNRTYPAARPPFMAFKLFVFPHGPFG